MRRHAEGLIILSGAIPGRGWRDPVPVLDVLRAAIAEVEDYIRVDVASESREAVVGAAVNDVIHLVAELAENATTFSPPNTRVEIRADAVGNGFAVEVEDRGLGLTEEELAEINTRLASPPEFDLANSDQLGLFVVGQLAARHGIKVSLRESPYGGTTAIVLIPHSLLARSGTGAESRLTGRRSGPGGTGQQQLVTSAAAAGLADPQAADLAGNRERSATFSLTGRHRAMPLPAAGPAAEELEADGLTAGEMTQPGFPAIQVTAAAAEPGIVAGSDGTAWPDRTARPTASRAGASGTHRGLPRRVRQASLAPQLRTGRRAEPEASPATPAAAESRSPEQAAAMMTSLQDGWQRGRIDDLDDMGGPGDVPGTPGTSEGEAG